MGNLFQSEPVSNQPARQGDWQYLYFVRLIGANGERVASYHFPKPIYPHHDQHSDGHDRPIENRTGYINLYYKEKVPPQQP